MQALRLEFLPSQQLPHGRLPNATYCNSIFVNNHHGIGDDIVGLQKLFGLLLRALQSAFTDGLG